MNNIDLFLDKYRQFEQIVRAEYGLRNGESVVRALGDEPSFKDHFQSLRYCSEVRNLLSHTPKIAGRYAVDPSDQMIALMDSLVNVVSNRKKCIDVCIPASKVYSRTLEDELRNTMATMINLTYTHVPVMDGGKVIGVFDENALFEFLATDEFVVVDDGIRLKTLEEFLRLDGREMEVFLFKPKDMYIDELKAEFESYTSRGLRVGVVFITETGSQDEDMLGIITPWDLASI